MSYEPEPEPSEPTSLGNYGFLVEYRFLIYRENKVCQSDIGVRNGWQLVRHNTVCIKPFRDVPKQGELEREKREPEREGGGLKALLMVVVIHRGGWAWLGLIK